MCGTSFRAVGTKSRQRQHVFCHVLAGCVPSFGHLNNAAALGTNTSQVRMISCRLKAVASLYNNPQYADTRVCTILCSCEAELCIEHITVLHADSCAKHRRLKQCGLLALTVWATPLHHSTD